MQDMEKEEAAFAEEGQAALADLLWNDVPLPACLAARWRDCCRSPLCLSCIVYDTSSAAVFYDMHAASSGRLELAARCVLMFNEITNNLFSSSQTDVLPFRAFKRYGNKKHFLLLKTKMALKQTDLF